MPEPSSIPTLLLPTGSAARALSISPRTLWTLTRNGEIPVVKIGRSKLYDVRDLMNFIESKKSPARDPSRLASTDIPASIEGADRPLGPGMLPVGER